MKTLLFTLFLCFSTNLAIAQFPEAIIGEWTGTGTLMGESAAFEMKWERVLGEEFVRLTFRNKVLSGSFSMVAHGYYKPKANGFFSGYWFDSRGVSFPLKGTFTSTAIITEWGNSEIEQGKTEYKLLSSGEMAVTDFVLQDGIYSEFGKATYKLKQ